MARAKNLTRALVLSGGGARAAYQAGVLRALAELLREAKFREQPFRIFTGESAGAINATMLASHAEDFYQGAEELWDCWHELEMSDILAVHPLALAANASRWMVDLSLGGLVRTKSPVFLLNNAPIKKYLTPKINFGRIRDLIHDRQLLGVGISATNYATGSAVTFFDSAGKVAPWARSQRVGLPTELKLAHVLASAAIPILFPPVHIGNTFFGDGSVRLKAPLSPAIHLGAESILAISLRYHRSPEQTRDINETWKMRTITLADVAGVLLNAGFLDNLEGDLERLERINHTLSLIPPAPGGKPSTELKPIEALALRPSQDLGELAGDEVANFGAVLRFLLRGLGASQRGGADLLSYLAFDKAYTRKLLKLGYEDALVEKQALLAFFSA